MKHLVMLVPGFFGFAKLGGVRYFQHVEAALTKTLQQAGHEVRVLPVPTHPTGSIRKRARRLSEAISLAAPTTGEQVHVIGHSTGGLDARLLVTPGVSLDPHADEAGERVDTIVTLATPHHGTPVAGFFTSLAGKHLLLAISVLMVQSIHGGIRGRSSAWLGRLVSLASRWDDILGLDNTVFDYLARQLLADFDEESREEVIRWAESISNDRGALLQISPEGMDIFNAAIPDNPEVRYLSYITAAPRPTLRGLAGGLRDPYYPMSYMLFSAIYRVAAQDSAQYPYPSFPTELSEAAERAWGVVPDPMVTDGLVPSCSQTWGRVSGIIRGDHLDVCGHFHPGPGDRAHTDWLRSGSGFGIQAFEALWRDISMRLIGAAPGDHGVDGFVPVAPDAEISGNHGGLA